MTVVFGSLLLGLVTYAVIHSLWDAYERFFK